MGGGRPTEHLAGRQERHDEIDEAIAQWTRRQDKYDLMHLLQAHGMPPAPC